MDYFDLLFSKIKYSDDFGWLDVHRIEVNKWLENVVQINPNFIEKNKSRFVKIKQRDEALAEIMALYIVKKIWQLDVVTYKDNSVIDFVYRENNTNVNAEVTSTSWRREVAESFIAGEISLQKHKKRLTEPKILSGEGRWVGFEGMENCINHGLKKFTANGHNNMFIHLDTFGDLFLLGEMEQWHTFKELARSIDKHKVIREYTIFQILIDGSGLLEYKVKRIPSDSII